MKAMRQAACVAVVLFAAVGALATTINVPGDQLTIQDGITVASAGDTVLVECGTYYEHDIVMKSGVHLRSEEQDASCVTIDGERLSRVFICIGLSSDTRIVGFTVTRGLADGGYPEYCGGGMYCFDSSPVLSNIVFMDNEAESRGGGIYCVYDSHPQLTSVVLAGNRAVYGGGVFCWGGPEPTLADVTFDSNEADDGGGLYCYDSAPTLTNVTFSQNSAATGSSICLSHWGSPVIVNSIIGFSENEEGGSGEPIHCYGRGTPDISHSILFPDAGSDTLCISPGDVLIEDPRFCNIYAGDLSLCSNSPCLPANNSWGELIGAFPEGCDDCDSPVKQTSWGALKALFR